MTNPYIIDQMDGHQFEYYCAGLLKRLGYKNVAVTKGSGDNGVDIFAEQAGITYAIQCKCYRSKVGNHAVQEVFSGRAYYNKDVAVVLTNSYFTEQAKNAARRTGVILWDRTKLLSMDRLAYPPVVARPISRPVPAKYSPQKLAEIKRNIALDLAGKIFFALIVGFLGLICLFFTTDVLDGDPPKQSNTIQGNGFICPEIDDFEYRIVNRGICLQEYKGNASSIIIPSTYTIDGIEYPVLKLENTFKYSYRISDLILSDGIEYIEHPSYAEMKNLERLYIPASLTGSKEFLNNITSGYVLYYGGTKEQWKAFRSQAGRSDFSFTSIVFEANISDCLNGKNTHGKGPVPTTYSDYTVLADFCFDVRDGITTLGRCAEERK